MNSQADVFRLSDLPDPMDEQFRMRQLSVMNWGTFTGLHRMPVSRIGTLIIGPSGAGKSTLLDAISALTVSPRSVRFNAAADESGKRDPDRTLMSYVRGAWAERADDDSARILAKQYLRGGATWSAVALEYGNALGRVITLVRVLWVRGAGSSAKVESHFLVVDESFDLAQIGEFSGEKKELTKRFSAHPFRSHDSFTSFSEHWCRVVGIAEPDALNLLHQTQSTKNLGDLNAFLRDYMLAEPKTFEIAESLVIEFVDLDEAHRAVVVARDQISVLGPSRQAYQEKEAAEAEVQRIRSLIAYIPQFKAKVLGRLLGEEVLRLESTIRTSTSEAEAAERRLGEQASELEGLRGALEAGGGGSLAQLEAALTQLQQEKTTAARRRTSAEEWAQHLDLSLATDEAAFAEQVHVARQFIAQTQGSGEASDAERVSLGIEEARLVDALRSMRSELEALERGSSSMPREKQDIRARMCGEIGIPHSRVPYAGELISVKPEHGEWEGAANRLLHGFAISMLVDVNDYRQVAKWVDRTHLGQRLTYFQAEPTASSGQRARRPNLLLNFLHVSESPFRHWIWAELWRIADFECVDSISELMQGSKRITRAGQIRYGGGRHLKDDRFRVDDKSQWVLGDNRGKLERFRQDAAETGLALEIVQAKRRETNEAAAKARKRELAATRFADLDWSSIDVAHTLQKIARNLDAQRDLQANNPKLVDLQGRVIAKREEVDALRTGAAELRIGIKRNREELIELEHRLQQEDLDAMGLLPEAEEGLSQRCGQWAPTLRSVGNDLDKVRSALDIEKDTWSDTCSKQMSKILSGFQAFLHRWPEERGALQANLASATDFFSKLDRLETDGLPRHEARFQELLRKQSMQRLAELSQHLHEARSDIENGMDDVNQALRPVPYNPDTYLYIRTVDRGLDEPREFKRRLGTLFAQRGDLTEASAESQFEGLRSLIEDLRGDDPAKKQWREIVLDVRRHVEFIADECDRVSGVAVENYSGAGGKSGGQRQKLTATCLAAALRFKLGGSDGGVPAYAAVVLDEAFTKTDNEFTATCMRIFTGLGFQMIVATPMKSVLTLEEFVGGATYVSIKDRKVSGLLHIDYDAQSHRLALPEVARRKMERED